jgi:hypothetical protein
VIDPCWITSGLPPTTPEVSYRQQREIQTKGKSRQNKQYKGETKVLSVQLSKKEKKEKEKGKRKGCQYHGGFGVRSF